MVKLLLRTTIVISLLLIGACGSDPSSSLDTPADLTDATESNYVPGEVLLRFHPEASAARAAAADTDNLLAGARVAERITIGGYHRGRAARAGVVSVTVPAIEILRLQLPEGMSVKEGITRLTARSDVLYAEPNYRVHKAMVPNDPFYAKQWGLQNTGQKLTGDKGTFTGTPGVDIGAVTAWDVSTSDGSFIVATIDSGIDYDHPDLSANIWINPGESGEGKEQNSFDDDGNGYNDDYQGWNFYAENNDPKDDDLDTNGHGSHLAGIIGAVGNNSLGVSGIHRKTQLMPLKFFPEKGGGNIFNAVKAINYAVANGARVINASYEYTSRPDWVQSELTAIAAAEAAGVLFVAAAGNGNSNYIGYNIDTGSKVYPAAHALDNIIAVAATDPNDKRASFSNYGATSVDLGAPGVNIYSTVRSDRTGLDHQLGYDYMSGTSMATPMVSGAVALIWSQHPELTSAQVRQLLFYTVDTTTSLQGKVATGGRLNLGRAMTADTSLPAPAVPTGLINAAQVAGASLSWNNQSDNESFIVERSLSGQPYVVLARLDAEVTSFTDSSVSAGSVVSYRIKAIAGFRASAYSDVLEVTVPFLLPPPSSLHYTSDAQGIHLSWSDSSPDAKGYKIERRAESVSTFSEIASLPTDSAPGYTDSDVVAGGRYYYRVYSYSNTLGNSDYSNEILAQMAGGGSSSGSSNCFIATAAFGTPLAPHVNTLRAFRDRVLLTNTPGRLFVALYYRTSPPLADFIAEHDLLRAGVRTLLRPLIWLATLVTPNEVQAMGLRRAPPTTISEEEADVVAGELLVCFRPELSAEAIATILRAEQSERLEQIASPQGTLLRIKLASGVTTTAAQKSFSAYQEVVYAEPNRRVSIRKP